MNSGSKVQPKPIENPASTWERVSSGMLVFSFGMTFVLLAIVIYLLVWRFGDGEPKDTEENIDPEITTLTVNGHSDLNSLKTTGYANFNTGPVIGENNSYRMPDSATPEQDEYVLTFNRSTGEAEWKLSVPLFNMVWKGQWDGSDYVEGNVVQDEGWAMVANKSTNDSAAPQRIGEQEYVYDGAVPPELKEDTKALTFGQRYTILDSGFITGYRVYTVTGQSYAVFSVKEPLSSDPEINQLLSLTATSTGWTGFNFQGLVPSNVQFDLVCIAYLQDGAPTETKANYDYRDQKDSKEPDSGQITHADRQSDELRISKFDFSGADRSALLAGLTKGDHIILGSIDWIIESSSDDITSVRFIVAPAVQWSVNGVQSVTFSSVTSQEVKYHEAEDEWVSNSNIKGIISLTGDYDTADINDNQYGIDLQIQEANISEDWDFMSYS